MQSRSLRILVVDDHAIAREAVAWILSTAQPGWMVAQAASGDDAIDHLRLHPADVVVTDLRMPGLCGLELVHRLHAGWPDLPILVLSMHAEPAMAAGAECAGATGYLAKKRGSSELVEAVTAVAAGRRHFLVDDMGAPGPRDKSGAARPGRRC